MSTETALSRWLRDEMNRRGYPVGGPKSGGISRLAADADLPQGTISRLVNGKAEEPDTATLRAVGRVLGYTLGEMLVHAGLAEPDEMTHRPAGQHAPEPDISRPPSDFPNRRDWDGLSEAEQWVWHTPVELRVRELLASVVQNTSPQARDRSAGFSNGRIRRDA